MGDIVQPPNSARQNNESKRQVHGSLGYSNLEFGDGNQSDGEFEYQRQDQDFNDSSMENLPVVGF